MEALKINTYTYQDGKLIMCLNYNEYKALPIHIQNRIRTRFAFDRDTKYWVGKSPKDLGSQKALATELKLTYSGKEKEIILEELTALESATPSYIEPPETPAAGVDSLKLMRNKDLVAMFEAEAMPVEEQKRRDRAYEEVLEQPADLDPFALMQGEDEYVAESSYEQTQPVYKQQVNTKTQSNSMAEVEEEGLFSWVSAGKNTQDDEIPF